MKRMMKMNIELFILVLLMSLNLYTKANAQEMLGDGRVLIGDMIVDQSSLQNKNSSNTGIVSGGQGLVSGLSISKTATWPNGVITVSFPSSLTADKANIFMQACEEWSKAANVSCRESINGELKIIENLSITDCNATLGYSKRNEMNMSPNCWRKDIVMHELGHVLGFAHEHQRSDRDNFVTINYKNMDSTKISNFSIFYAFSQLGAYDIFSIMHYGSFAYSNDLNSKTIEAKNRDIESVGASELSFLDMLNAARTYGPREGGTVDRQIFTNLLGRKIALYVLNIEAFLSGSPLEISTAIDNRAEGFGKVLADQFKQSGQNNLKRMLIDVLNSDEFMNNVFTQKSMTSFFVSFNRHFGSIYKTFTEAEVISFVNLLESRNFSEFVDKYFRFNEIKLNNALD